MSIQITHDENPQAFWGANASNLLESESLHTLLLDLTHKELRCASTENSPHFFTVGEGESIVGQSIYDPSQEQLHLSPMHWGHVDALGKTLLEIDCLPKRLHGPAGAVEIAADWFASSRNLTKRLVQRFGLYELRHLKTPTPKSGTMVCGRGEDQGIAQSYLLGFMKECFPNPPPGAEKISSLAKTILENKALYFWKTTEEAPVAMAGKIRDTPSTVSLSMVFVPPEERGKGYSGALVAALSQHYLDQGKKACNLFADLDHPVSNRIYTELGYDYLTEFRVYEL